MNNLIRELAVYTVQHLIADNDAKVEKIVQLCRAVIDKVESEEEV